MKFLKSLLMGTGGVVFAGLVLALLAPKAVHALAATTVQVVNTSASPAITEDTSRQASQIVTIQCLFTPSACNQRLANGSAAASGPNGGYVVPANQYLVLKTGDYYNPGGSAALIGFYNLNLLSFYESIVLPPNGQVPFSSGIVVGPAQELLLGNSARSTAP
jgi:hypothetical protein